MTLARLCEHLSFDSHLIDDEKDWAVEATHCPGGSLLPPDTLIIVKEDGEWPKWALFALGWIPEEARAKRAYTRILDALAAAKRGNE